LVEELVESEFFALKVIRKKPETLKKQ